MGNSLPSYCTTSTSRHLRISILDVLAAVLLCAPLCVTVNTGLQAARVCCGPSNVDCVVLAEDSPRAWELRNDLSRWAQTFPRV